MVAQIVITWSKETGVLNIQSREMTVMEMLGVLDMAAHTVGTQNVGGAGRPGRPPATPAEGQSPGAMVRSPGFIVNKVS